MDKFTIFTWLFDQINNGLDAFVTSSVDKVIGFVAPTALVGVTIYVMGMGYMIIAGKIQEPFSEFLFKSVKMILIAYFALQSSSILTYVQGGFNGLISAFASLSGSSNSTIYGTLDDYMTQGLQIVVDCFAKMNPPGSMFPDLSFLIYGLIIAASLLVFLCGGGMTMMIASIGIKLMTIFAPFFITCLLFPVVRSFFDRWLSQSLNYVFTIIVVGLIIGMGMAIFMQVLGTISVDDDSNMIFSCTGLVFVSWFLYRLISEAHVIAGGLVGGISTFISIGQAAAFGGSVGRAIGNATGVRPLANYLGGSTQRHDPSTGLQTGGSRFEHIVQGRTMVNQPYRQAVVGKMKESWGKSAAEDNSFSKGSPDNKVNQKKDES